MRESIERDKGSMEKTCKWSFTKNGFVMIVTGLLCMLEVHNTGLYYLYWNILVFRSPLVPLCSMYILGLKWNVMTRIRMASNIFIFAALYCFCLEFKGLLALPRKEWGNKGFKSKNLALKCYKERIFSSPIEFTSSEWKLTSSALKLTEKKLLWPYSIKWIQGEKQSLQVLLENLQVLLESDIIL